MKCVSVFFLVAFLAAALAVPKYDDFPPVDEIIAFIESIELAEPKFKPPPSNLSLVKVGLPPDNKKQGYVVGGGITAFTENVKGQAKQDILDATLFAQLAADKQYDREKDTQNWYKFYINVLGNIGFAVQGFNFQEYKSKGGSFVMSEVVLQILAAIATGGQSAVIQATLIALQGMSNDDRRIQIFSHQSSSYTTGNFQIYPCDQASTGEVSLALGAFSFTSSQSRVDFLFFSYGSSSCHIYQGAQSAVLNSKVYQQVRGTISTKLGNNAVEFVAAIDI